MTDKTKVDDGGQIHPRKVREQWESPTAVGSDMVDYPGISRRDACADEIAAQLLCAGRIACMLLSIKGVPEKIMEDALDLYMPKGIAKAAYELTDALIAEGKK